MNQGRSIHLSEDAQGLMVIVDTFEKADDETRSDIYSFLKSAPPQLRESALPELVIVDFQKRWKSRSRRTVREYLDQYPELFDASASLLELLQTEFEWRQRDGELPDVSEYRSIYPPFEPRSGVDTLGPAAKPGSSPARPEAPPSHTVAPKRIGKYVVMSVLGEGQFGVVYKAWDEDVGRHVAIKLRRGLPGKSGLTADQKHEAQSAGALSHKGIVTVYEVGETSEGAGYVVYELIEGDSMQNRITKRDYSLEQAVEWVAKTADALQSAHKRNIFHRDIKPANIMIDGAGEPKVVDFGLARRDNQFFVPDAGQLIGTAAYMSPEQARGEANWVTSQSDIYSLGIVLYELLCHQRPFQSQTLTELLQEVLHRTPPPPRSINDEIPKAVENICLKALEKNPTLRFRTAADLAEALRASLRPPVPAWIPLVRFAATAVAAAAIVALAIMMWPAPVPPPVAPSLTKFAVYRKGKSVMDIDRPLTSKDALELQTRSKIPAYSYVLMYPQEGSAKLLFASDKPVSGKGADAIDVSDLHLDDTDGATLIVGLVAAKPLTPEELAAVQALRTNISASPEEAAHEPPYHWSFSYNNDQELLPSPPLERGFGEVRFADDFKTGLKSKCDAYYGILISHTKGENPTQE